jgi:hypothetical protein
MGSRLRFWLYLAATYAVLVLPLALALALIVGRNRPEVSLVDYGPTLLLVSLWPLSLVVGTVAIWYLGAFFTYAFWKYLEVIQFVTGLPFGERLGRAIARDHFFVHAAPTSPYAWVHRKAAAAYPPGMDAKQNA